MLVCTFSLNLGQLLRGYMNLSNSQRELTHTTLKSRSATNTPLPSTHRSRPLAFKLARNSLTQVWFYHAAAPAKMHAKPKPSSISRLGKIPQNQEKENCGLRAGREKVLKFQHNAVVALSFAAPYYTLFWFAVSLWDFSPSTRQRVKLQAWEGEEYISSLKTKFSFITNCVWVCFEATFAGESTWNRPLLFRWHLVSRERVCVQPFFMKASNYTTLGKVESRFCVYILGISYFRIFGGVGGKETSN